MFKIALCQTFTETKPLTEQNSILKEEMHTFGETGHFFADTFKKLLGHLNTIPNLGMLFFFSPISNFESQSVII